MQARAADLSALGGPGCRQERDANGTVVSADVLAAAAAAAAATTTAPGAAPALEACVETAYRAASQRLLAVLTDRHRLREHLRGLRAFLLLGAGDFVRQLMGLLFFDLQQPASRPELLRHNLAAKLEAALRTTAASALPGLAPADAAAVTRCLDVHLLEVAAHDLGWDVFSLNYVLDGPLTAVLTPDARCQYLRSAGGLGAWPLFFFFFSFLAHAYAARPCSL